MEKASNAHPHNKTNYDKYTNIFDLIPYDGSNSSILSFMPLHINGKEIWRIVSADETHLLYDMMSRNTGIRDGILPAGVHPSPIQSKPNTKKSPVFLAYGVLIPQHGGENWSEETVRGMLDHFKRAPLQSVQREGEISLLNIYRYRHYAFDYTQLCKRGHIPCAFLMDASIDYLSLMKTAQNDEDFLGVVMSPTYLGFSAADNILNRDFVIVIRDIEPDFNAHRLFWKRAIRKDKLRQVAETIV